jgi:hypothetical protein
MSRFVPGSCASLAECPHTWIRRLAASQAVCPLPSGPVHKCVHEAWLVTPGWAVPDSA